MLSLKRSMIKRDNTAEPVGEKRLSERLPIKRLNVDIAGSVLHTSNISKIGAQLVCPAMRYPSLERHLQSQHVEMVVELPTGRDMTIAVSLRYVCESDDEVLIGVEFEKFSGQDQRGWCAYIDWVTSAAELRAKRVA